MVSYTLPESLSFALVDRRPIFLDVARDRYFMLEAPAEAAFLDLASHRPVSPSAIAQLFSRGIIVQASTGSLAPAISAPAVASALEWPHKQVSCGAGIIAEVLATVLCTKRNLKLHGLKATLDHAIGKQTAWCERDQASAVRFALAFLQARRLVFTPTRCLLDSLSMAIFLGRRGLPCSIVFGVTGDPFTAHCWVKVGDTVLNDTVGHIASFTVIRAN